MIAKVMGEKALTATIGIIIGIAIAGGIFFGPQLLSKANPIKTAVSPVAETTPTPTPTLITNSQISITSLNNSDIVTSKTVTVSGKTFPGIKVVITSAADEQVVKSDDTGNFTVQLKIDEGENTIVAAITDARGTIQSDKKQIVLEISE